MGLKQPLPEQYRHLDLAEALDRIEQTRNRLGSRVLILGHHYQRDEVIRFADYTGDSFKLAQAAATRREAEYIVFCGVHFMAESADILCTPHQQVILPDLSAGCSMADMAHIDQALAAWDQLTERVTAPIIPITYINSTAEIKAFCARHGGAVCTSSNAARVLEWALTRGERVLFLPDQHLGRNTAYAMGIPLEDMVLWDPDKFLGGNDEDRIRQARIYLWKGYCSVHQMFKLTHITHFRQHEPLTKIIVHPECEFDVVQNADLSGSTETIIRTVREAPAGSRWAVGTEIHLVDRLAQELTDRSIVPLTRFGCLCSTMYRIDPLHLLWVLESLTEGQAVNVIRVPDDTARWARVALDRMLEI